MRFTLRLEDHRDNGFVVQYKEEGTHDINQFYSSTSYKLALDEYHKIRHRLDPKSFKIIYTSETIENTYTTFECLLQFVLFTVNKEEGI